MNESQAYEYNLTPGQRSYVQTYVSERMIITENDITNKLLLELKKDKAEIELLKSQVASLTEKVDRIDDLFNKAKSFSITRARLIELLDEMGINP